MFSSPLNLESYIIAFGFLWVCKDRFTQEVEAFQSIVSIGGGVTDAFKAFTQVFIPRLKAIF